MKKSLVLSLLCLVSVTPQQTYTYLRMCEQCRCDAFRLQFITESAAECAMLYPSDTVSWQRENGLCLDCFDDFDDFTPVIDERYNTYIFTPLTPPPPTIDAPPITTYRGCVVPAFVNYCHKAFNAAGERLYRVFDECIDVLYNFNIDAEERCKLT